MDKRRRAKPWKIGYEPDPLLAKQQLKDLVEALNRTKIRVAPARTPEATRVHRLKLTRQQAELRRLVEKWMESGPNLRKMLKQEPELATRMKDGKTTFWPTETGRGHLDWVAYPSKTELPTPEDAALIDFMTLITNPEWELLGGPCARCGDFYLKKARRHSKYCSRTCSSTETALSATQRRRAKEQEMKIGRAQKLIDQWCKLKPRQAWKKWVSRQPGITNRWLTRAENNKKITPPTAVPSREVC